MSASDEKVPDVERDGALAAESTTMNGNSRTPTVDDDGNTTSAESAHRMTENEEKGEMASEGDAQEQNGGAKPSAADDAAPPPHSSDRSKAEMAVIMVALCSALFLAALDITIVTTAIPTIVQEFNAASGYTWVGAAYTLANSASVPSWGKFSDIFGRKPMLLIAVAIFWIGSLISALSKDIGQLIAGRAVQGFGGGGIVVLINIAVGDLVSPRERGTYYGIFGGVWALASAVGPILGGVLTSKASWRWCFWINLPISGLGFFILLFALKLHNPRTPIRQGLAAIDWTGSLLIVGATLMLLFGLELGGVYYPWKSATIISLLIFSAVTFTLFMLVEKYFAKFPVIPLRLFKSRKNLMVFGACFIHGAVFIISSYYLPLYFQAVVGASPLLSGVYLLPSALATSFLSAGVGIWMKKTGQYLPPIIFGFVFMTLGYGLFIDLGVKVNFAKIIVYQIIAGIGIGPNFQSPLIALQSGIPPKDIGSGTSTFQFIRQLATTIAIVVGSVVFQNGMQKQYPKLLAELGPQIAQQLSGSNAGASVGLVQSLQGEQGLIARTAYWKSLQEMFIVFTALSAVGVIISPLIGQTKLSKDHTEYKTGLKTLAKNDGREQKKDEGETSS